MEYKKSPLKAIRANCLECLGLSARSVMDCTSPNCYLYPFRFGKNPYRKKRVVSEEQKEALLTQLEYARNAHKLQG